MPKYGISIKIDVTKIDKARLFKGERGTYLDLTTFVDTDAKDEYDNNGFITQSPTKEERAAKERMPILGNVKVFFSDGGKSEGKPSQSEPAPGGNGGGYDDDIPFAAISSKVY